MPGEKCLLGTRVKINFFSITERVLAAEVEVKGACDEENLVVTTNKCEVKVFLKDAKGSVHSQKVQITLTVKQLAEKPMKRAPNNNTSKENMQRKENERGLQDVDTMEGEVATHTVKELKIPIHQYWRQKTAPMHADKTGNFEKVFKL